MSALPDTTMPPTPRPFLLTPVHGGTVCARCVATVLGHPCTSDLRSTILRRLGGRLTRITRSSHALPVTISQLSHRDGLSTPLMQHVALAPQRSLSRVAASGPFVQCPCQKRTTGKISVLCCAMQVMCAFQADRPGVARWTTFRTFTTGFFASADPSR